MANTLDYGRDTYCIDELKPGRWATGVQLLAQRCYHRLITPARLLGAIGGEDEADFGMDLAGEVGATAPSDRASMLPVKVRNELIKDPTVDTVDVSAVRNTAGGVETWMLTIKVTSAAGPFELLVSASEVTVELLGVR